MGFVLWLDATLPGWSGADPLTIVASLEALTAAVDGLAVENGTRCMLAIWLVLTDQAHLVSAVLEDVLTGDKDASDMWLPTARATRAVADVLDGRVQEGLGELDRVCHEAAHQTTHWRYVVYWLAALGHFLAEDGDDANEAMRLALIETRDSSMYWSISWAVETAALHCLRLGDRELAAPVLAALDAELGRHGGRPLSGHPSTILHPIRQSLTHSRHDTVQLPPLSQAQAVDRLLLRLG
jgi:hypothetical protein